MIRCERKRKGLTQQELADHLNSDRQYVCKLEKGKVNITADYLDKVINKLESRHEEFFNARPSQRF